MEKSRTEKNGLEKRCSPLQRGDSCCRRAVRAIVMEHYRIIGPVAITRANSIAGIRLNAQSISLSGKNYQGMVDTLVGVYQTLIGLVAITLARNALKRVGCGDLRVALPRME